MLLIEGFHGPVGAHLGQRTRAEQVRIWYTDNALHADEEAQEDPTHTVSYLGVLHQALRGRVG